MRDLRLSTFGNHRLRKQHWYSQVHARFLWRMHFAHRLRNTPTLVQSFQQCVLQFVLPNVRAEYAGRLAMHLVRTRLVHERRAQSLHQRQCAMLPRSCRSR